MITDRLREWIKNNRLKVEFLDSRYLEIDGAGKFYVVKEKEVLFDEEFDLILDEEEFEYATGVDYLVFLFGGRYYYTDKLHNPELLEFKYLGKVDTQLEQEDVPFMGVHGGYDLCNGSGRYSDC